MLRESSGELDIGRMNLDTLGIDATTMRAYLVWRGPFRSKSEVRVVEIRLDRGERGPHG